MNPMTNVKNIKKLSEQDIKLGGKSSWHDQYKDSAWIFIGGLPYDLTEGDIICVFSQYGEIVNINLVRDKDSGKQKGFCFLCYEDQRSTILAVDNLNSIKLLGRTLRVDHVENYKAPKEGKKNPIDDETRLLREEGCAPQSKAIQPVTEPQIKTEDIIVGGVRLPPRLPIGPIKTEPIKTEPKDSGSDSKKSKKKHKKNKDMDKLRTKIKKEKKSKKKKRKQSTSSSSDSSSESDSDSQSSESEEERKRRRKKHRK